MGDANDLDLITRALEVFRKEQERPTLIVLDSHIGWGSPHKVDTAEVHGEPLGEEEVRETKRAYGWPEDAQFLVPDGVREHFDEGIGGRGARAPPGMGGPARELHAGARVARARDRPMQRRELPEGWDADIPSFEPDEKGMATRKASNQVENAVAARIPWLLAGSADLTGSTSVGLKDVEGAADFEPDDRAGRQLHLGIREHGSAALSNGLSLSKLRPLWSTYLTFSDYAKPGIRLSALMELPVIHLFTHDSIGLGEDGPTHQPVEHLAGAARDSRPRRDPAGRRERGRGGVAGGARSHPPARRTRADAAGRADHRSLPLRVRGGAAARAATCSPIPRTGDPEVILIATGSEVALAVAAHEKLISEGVRSRVVSLPCWELFERQDQSYRDEVLPPGVTARVSIEEASTLGWERFVGFEGAKIGMHTFGSSAPLKDVQSKFGFTPDKVAETAKEVLGR